MQWAEPVAICDHPSDSGTELEFRERVVASRGFSQFSPGGKVCVCVCVRVLNVRTLQYCHCDGNEG